MKLSLSEQLMYSTVLIKCRYSNGDGSGTGFIFNFIKKEDTCVPTIVTNIHVIDGAISIQFEFCLKNDDDTPDDKHVITINAPSNFWIKHPDGIDLCCLPIGGLLSELENKGTHVFWIGLDESLIPSVEQVSKLSAIESLTMIGYPIGLSDTYNHKPILRRGITASHLKNDYMGKKEFLMDMACFPGSSGSPVFVLNEGFYAEGNNLNPGDRALFVGVLWGGPQYTASGELVSYSIPNICTNTPIPTNLGFAIKSSQLYRLEEELAKIIK